MGAQATFAVLFLLTAMANAKIKRTTNDGITPTGNTYPLPGEVEFWKEKFTMRCPENGTWFKKHADINHTSATYTQTYSGKTKGLYHCKYEPKGKEEKYHFFYVKGKGCADCFEVAPGILAAAIVVDVVGTACVMLMVFRCTKKKSSAASKARPGGRPPPAPSPHYEPLNLHTRSEGPYSTVSRTG
uniref:CD3 gamma/delta subunit Ig-like domain-containing protein n=1 Tax=Gasterosteus aculeatus aculeatus TaxID=481459 RepID=A0AAQ4RWX7_GASAC